MTPLRGLEVKLADRKHFFLGAAIFGLAPTASGISWVITTIVVMVGVAIASSWNFRIVILAFGIPEVLGLPWPTACFAAAAAMLWVEKLTLQNLVHRRSARTRWWMWLLLAGLGAASGSIVVLLDASQIKAGYTFPLPISLLPILPVLAIAATIFNALGEELLWRGVLTWLSRKETNRILLVAMQSMSFGVAHYFGIPQGISGMAAAAVFSGFIYAVARRYGFAGALLVHLLADAVIFFNVIQYAQFAWSG